jgi:8-oxo-dGTP diphosphatase
VIPDRVAAAVIQLDGRFLLCCRPPGKRYAGLWEFPGGKLAPGESLHHGIERELAEELGVRTQRVEDVELSVPDPGSGFIIDFARVSIFGTPEAREHADLAWVLAEKLLDHPLAPSDHEFVVYLLGRHENAPA